MVSDSGARSHLPFSYWNNSEWAHYEASLYASRGCVPKFALENDCYKCFKIQSCNSISPIYSYRQNEILLSKFNQNPLNPIQIYELLLYLKSYCSFRKKFPSDYDKLLHFGAIFYSQIFSSILKNSKYTCKIEIHMYAPKKGEVAME